MLSRVALGQGGTSWNQMRQAGAHGAIKPAHACSTPIDRPQNGAGMFTDAWSPGILEAGLRHGDSSAFPEMMMCVCECVCVCVYTHTPFYRHGGAGGGGGGWWVLLCRSREPPDAGDRSRSWLELYAPGALWCTDMRCSKSSPMLFCVDQVIASCAEVAA